MISELSLESYSPKIFIYGYGRVGGTLYCSLSREGHSVKLYSRSKRGKDIVSIAHLLKNIDKFDIIILAVPERELKGVVDYLTNTLSDVKKRGILLHTSGTVSYKILLPLKKKGFRIGSLHPYFSFYRIRTDVCIDDIKFTLFCHKKDRPFILSSLKMIGITPYTLEDNMKIPYHISAVFVSNFSALLLNIAHNILKTTHLKEDEINDLIFSLLSSTLSNLKKYGINNTITGPAIRRDKEILCLHKNYLKKDLPELVRLYSLCSSMIQSFYSKPSQSGKKTPRP